MSDSKPGFFKRLFKFGRSKEVEEAPAEENQLEDANVVDADQLAAEADARAKVLAAEKEREELAAREAETAAREKAAREKIAQEKAEREALAEEAAKAAQEAERLAQEKLEEQQRLAEQKQQEEALAKQAEAEKRASEKKAQLEADAKAAEQAAERAAELERLEEERLEAERLEAERIEAEQLAAMEAAEKAEAERLAAQEAEAEQQKLAEQAKKDAENLASETIESDLASESEVQEEVAEPAANTPAPPSEKPKSWFSRMKDGLSRSSTQLTENITAVFTKRKLDEDTLQELEDILIQADLGVDTAMNITDALASQRMGKDVTDEEVREFMAQEVEKVLEPVASELELDLDHTPHVILVVGVNGSGKTTTIGKLSQKLYDAGFSTSLVAGDTFRAAAIEQLKIWGERTQSPVLFRPLGSDAAGLAYDAYTEAAEEGRDVMLMDTAGRLQNKTELMDELEKIIRVLKKHDPSAPHTVLLTLDATTGQNALNQVEIFKDVAGVNGLVMTKMDGTARGGIMVAIASKFKLPVYFIGVGEQVEDLEPFEAKEFARSIAGLDV